MRSVAVRPVVYAWALLCVLFCAHAFGQQVDVSKLTALTPAQATVAATFKSFNRGTKQTLYELSFTNASAASLHGPVYVTIEGISVPGVTVDNAAGLMNSGVPYFVVSSADVAAGATLTQNMLFGNPANARFTFTMPAYSTPATQTPPPALRVQITHPGTLITVGSTPLPIDGTVNDDSATLTVNGAPVSHAGGVFHANVALIEGHNAVIARAVNDKGEEATATISVSLDLTPPYITVESPTEGEVLTSAVITVSGLINDIVRGTVSEGQANVTVNGHPAAVSNRSYLAQNIPLQEGPNTIRVEGADQVGNTSATEVHVTYQVPTKSFIDLASGQAQTAQIREVLAQSLQAKLVTASGVPVPGKPVIFRVSQGDGVVGVGGSDAGTAVLVNSDSNGIASTHFRVGSRAGSGNNRVTAKAVGFEGEVVFVASATPKPGNKVSVNSGNNQRGAANEPLPLPFVVVVTDDGANVIEGAQVDFEVVAGGGALQNGQTHFTATTDSDGRASAKLTLGSTLGLDVQRVTATLVGNTVLTAGFTASALQTGPPGATSISGVVLDNQDHPLPNVTLRVDGTTREAKTDAQGRFKITEAPVGPVRLIADASTTTVPGEWPTLPYNIVTVPGADNPLSAPVYMVKLDTAHAVTVGAEDREVTLPEVPGFKLTVKAGSVTFPNGDKVGQLSVTPVNVSKIPMAPPNGMQPQFIVTIQPTGARFDPPAPLQLPNVDGHAPGTQVEMYSFDHDLEEFVSIGLGTVSADGTVIASNPGIGVIKAGWHGGSQPTGNGCVAQPPACRKFSADCLRTSPDDTNLPTDECRACSNGGLINAEITDVKATVDGLPEKWKVMSNPPTEQASFSFSASAKSTHCTNLIYRWDFGDGAEGTSEGFVHTYTASGRYTVKLTVSCSGCTTQSQTTTVKVVVIRITHQTAVSTPANRNRTTLGVGEEVALEAQPSNLGLQWRLAGKGKLDEVDADSQLFTAPGTAATSVLAVSKAPMLDDSGVVAFDVIPPSTVSMKWDGHSIPPEKAPLQPGEMGAQMFTLVTIGPSNVSFSRIKVIEIGGGPSNIHGYWENPDHPAPAHTPQAGFLFIDEQNEGQGGDKIRLANADPPWSPGEFQWEIPWHYQIIDDPGTTTTPFATVIQHFTLIDSTGKLTITKAGACVTRSPNDTGPGVNCGAVQ